MILRGAVDFSFLFIVILMVIAVQSGLWWIAAALFVLLLFSAKNKWLLAAAGLGGALVAGLYFTGGSLSPLVIIGGLFAILAILAKAGEGGAQGYGPSY
ncbi:MAG: hypothetical protein ACP5O3_01720 [Candidatus Micrarchaeia archaeon]